ncbi:MAG: UDP-2,3-diacylglucosamine diphosphatase, partial [Gammaproteobacteria bacterium]|nr:UDP-2,3-diacylglucosamine diphosphatase [Gammaproteobacteria bacterium]
IHLGKGAADTERQKELDLVACLRHHRDSAESLILVGDIFDYFIEYRNLLPKGFSRFQGMLAEWNDHGIPITYFVGNNDPWHIDYFKTEYDVSVVMDDRVLQLDGHAAYITHGDGLGRGWSKYKILKPILRNRLPVFLYRTLLPGDVGIGIAKFAKRVFSNDRINPATITQLRQYAEGILRDDAVSNVVMGHSHYPEVCEFEGGKYINTGSWHHNRTFGIADGHGIRLMEWTNGEARPFVSKVEPSHASK